LERTPAKDRRLGYLDSAVEQKFPGLGQFNEAQEMAAATLKATGGVNT
jgi:hypothetical protein